MEGLAGGHTAPNPTSPLPLPSVARYCAVLLLPRHSIRGPLPTSLLYNQILAQIFSGPRQTPRQPPHPFGFPAISCTANPSDLRSAVDAIVGPPALPTMDAAAIRDCIAATLDADADVRRRAELQLKQVRVCVAVWACCMRERVGAFGCRCRRGWPHAVLLLLLLLSFMCAPSRRISLSDALHFSHARLST